MDFEDTDQPKVLFIEDDPQQMDIFYIYFERNGIEIERSYDGPDGIRVAENWKPDLIVLDIRMEGMDGVEVMHQLSSSDVTRDIPVIAYTNYDPRQIMGDMLQMGTLAVWEKTIIRPPDLVSAVKALHSHLSGGGSKNIDDLRNIMHAAIGED